METLVDTSILGRLANRADRDHALAQSAIAKLHRNGEVLRLAPQNLIEFRNFATRPTSANGFGLSTPDAAALATTFESAFPLLDEGRAIYPAWRSLVDAANVIGKQVHDASLVAICHIFGIPKLLTFNTQHFQRLAGFGPDLIVLDPTAI